jgi:hypothetical protein
MKEKAALYSELFGLHKRLVSGDPTLLGDVATLVLAPLKRHLHAKLRGVDEHVIQEACHDALLEYGKSPLKANATTGAGVMGFLVLRAESRAKNALKRERRRGDVEGRFASGLRPKDPGNVVELAEHRREHEIEPSTPPTPDPLEHLERRDRRAELLDSATSPVDRRLIELMLDGRRSTSDFARVLGIEGMPLDDQKRVVKQHKDRLKVALQRGQARKDQPPRRRGRPPRSGPSSESAS